MSSVEAIVEAYRRRNAKQKQKEQQQQPKVSTAMQAVPVNMVAPPLDDPDETDADSATSDQEMEEFPLLSRETTSMEAGVMGACFGERSKEHDSYAHDVRFGRPDFGALASEEATRLLSLQDIHNTSLNEPPRLHAVTCGPESMVNAVRDGCETARKTSNQRVRVEFSAVRRSA